MKDSHGTVTGSHYTSAASEGRGKQEGERGRGKQEGEREERETE